MSNITLNKLSWIAGALFILVLSYVTFVQFGFAERLFGNVSFDISKGIPYWIVLSLVVAVLGKGRTIGFWWALICCLLLSPVLGLIIVALSKRVDEPETNKSA